MVASYQQSRLLSGICLGWHHRAGKIDKTYHLHGMLIDMQFVVSMIIYNISRKFNNYGIVSKYEGPALCRRGWEWYRGS